MGIAADGRAQSTRDDRPKPRTLWAIIREKVYAANNILLFELATMEENTGTSFRSGLEIRILDTVYAQLFTLSRSQQIVAKIYTLKISAVYTQLFRLSRWVDFPKTLSLPEP